MWSLEFVQVASDALIKSNKRQQSEDQSSLQLPTKSSSDPQPTPTSPMDALRPHLQRPSSADFLVEPEKDLIELGSSADSNGPGFEVDEDEDEDEIEQGEEPIPPLTTQTSLTDFEIVSDAEVSQAMDSVKVQTGWKQIQPAQQLREGFVWQKQLVFRSKLTMHTAYERKDNKEPAAVTCISVAK